MVSARVWVTGVRMSNDWKLWCKSDEREMQKFQSWVKIVRGIRRLCRLTADKDDRVGHEKSFSQTERCARCVTVMLTAFCLTSLKREDNTSVLKSYLVQSVWDYQATISAVRHRESRCTKSCRSSSVRWDWLKKPKTSLFCCPFLQKETCWQLVTGKRSISVPHFITHTNCMLYLF